MTIKEEIRFIGMLTKDLEDSVLEFDRYCKELQKKGRTHKPCMGYGSTAANPQGLTQAGTSYSIERKIRIIRERLNDLRKRVVYYNGQREQDND